MHVSACPKQAVARPKWELADIFRLHGEDYRHSRGVPRSHRKVMHLIGSCRTSNLGGHLQRCDSCGYEQPSYNSCRNRHCPKCQTMTKEKWLQDRKNELLPAKYFHNVFTLPHELNVLVLTNKKIAFNMLFRSASETLKDFAKDPRWKLQGQLGFIAVLHTWSQVLLDHFHLHCLIPAGALSLDRKRWASSREDYLFCVNALSKAFRGKFLFYLKKTYRNRKIVFPGKASVLEQPKDFYRFLDSLYHKDWVVYSKRPFAGPAQVLEYLGRYTHRVAISNNRIRSVENAKVTFAYKDRSNSNKTNEMTLQAEEFIRRFLLHVLPDGFMRIRHFGFMANVCKKKNLRIIRELLGQSFPDTSRIDRTVREMMLDLTGIDIALCPHCKTGTMTTIKPLPSVHRGHDPPYKRVA